MYAFRRPWTSATYEDFTFWGDVELKTALAISQLLGYALSKLIGIKICSETTRAYRALMLFGLIIAAEIALFFFAVLPNNLKVVAIFMNGLPLGMVWGMVTAYLEGRRMSDLLLAGLSCSFIISSGIVKDVGLAVMSFGVNEFWMPFVTGWIFLPIFIFSVWMLDQIPEPSEADIEDRSQRAPMTGEQRWAFMMKYFFGMTTLFLAYFVFTAYRDFRDTFQMEIFQAFGYGEEPGIFTQSEFWVAFIVIGTMALINLFKDNRAGLMAAYAAMIFGSALMGVGTLLLDLGLISGLLWMILVGSGAYLAYVPYNCVLFERLIASTRVVGTVVFAIYVADTVGYVGSISLLFSKDILVGDMSHLDFFRNLSYGASLLCVVVLVMSLIYFMARTKRSPQTSG